MLSMMVFLMVLGLIVFGPKKTIEMAQTVGRSVNELKKSVADSDLGSIMKSGDEVSRRIDEILAQQSIAAPLPVAPPSVAGAANPGRSRSTDLASSGGTLASTDC